MFDRFLRKVRPVKQSIHIHCVFHVFDAADPAGQGNHIFIFKRRRLSGQDVGDPLLPADEVVLSP